MLRHRRQRCGHCFPLKRNVNRKTRRKRANGKKCNDQKSKHVIKLNRISIRRCSRGHLTRTPNRATTIWCQFCDAMLAHNQFHHSFKRILFTIMEMNGEYGDSCSIFNVYIHNTTSFLPIRCANFGPNDIRRIVIKNNK